MTKSLKQVLDFQEEKEQGILPPQIEGLFKITDNGEICWDFDNKQYVVFEETYAYEVGRTAYPKIAVAMLQIYVEEYLVH